MNARLDPVAPGGAPTRIIEPLGHGVDATVTLPGSKSITNRALVVAALAAGTSTLHGILDADDTAAMIDCVSALGATVTRVGDTTVSVDGVGGQLRTSGAMEPVVLPARLSGTTARFMMAVCALGEGRYTIDGFAPLRARPMEAGIGALRSLGARVDASGPVANQLPVTVSGGPVAGGELQVDASVSSQFLSGLAMAGVCMPDGLTLVVPGAMVSGPYVHMTASVMEAFGASVEIHDAGVAVAGGGYRPQMYEVEPDASAASYFFAAAAVCGGTVRVGGLGTSSLQGDVGFARVLGRMGVSVTVGVDHVELTRHPDVPLRGITADLSAISDTAPTLAAVAVFADGPTEVTGVGFIRHKETDRIAAVVTELGRLGVRAEATDDGFIVYPGPIEPAAVRTYDDHRMAMAFSVVGLGARGVTIVDPQCVNKTYPRFFDDLDRLRHR